MDFANGPFDATQMMDPANTNLFRETHGDAVALGVYVTIIYAELALIMIMALKPSGDNGVAYRNARIRALEQKLSITMGTNRPAIHGPSLAMINSAFTALQDQYGVAMINSLRSALTACQQPQLRIIYTYVLSMYNNSGAIGYRAILDLLIRPKSSILKMQEYAVEVASIIQFAKGLIDWNDKTKEYLGFYSFMRQREMSYTELYRAVPNLLGLVGAILMQKELQNIFEIKCECQIA